VTRTVGDALRRQRGRGCCYGWYRHGRPPSRLTGRSVLGIMASVSEAASHLNAAARRLELEPDALRRRLDPSSFPFRTTAEVDPLVGTIGQPRALAAIEFGLQVETLGYNLFIAGVPGSGRLSTVRDFLERFAQEKPGPHDWVYVHNFADPDRPNAIALPAGHGGLLAHDMDELLRAARREIPRVFESEDYERRRRAIVAELAQGRELLVEELKRFARERDFEAEITPVGIATVALVDGRPLTQEQFERLPADQQERIRRVSEELEEPSAAYVRRLRQLEKETAERIGELEREVGGFVTGSLFQELRDRHTDNPEVLDYLRQVEDDALTHLDEFREPREGQLPFPFGDRKRDDFARYRVNVFVDNGATRGAPVVLERNPTYYNLLGRVEYRAAFGAMVTDFREIKAGALHRANGGFLVLELLDVLRHPFAWEALKRALRGRELRIENLGEEFSGVPSATLRPEPIPLELKVALIGTPLLYHLLYLVDEDFRELFKVKADFAPEMAWSEQHLAGYAGFVRRCIDTHGLRHFDRAAVARLIEHGARLREHQGKISTQLREISDVATEASFWAGRAGRDVVAPEDVEQALAEKEYRSNLLEERVRDLIADGTIVIDTDGRRVGQLNGLSILDMGDYAFGRPSRVSARVSLGQGTVESIEREIELSGPIHSKGFLILSGYIRGKYAQELPLALAATITFEQSYDEVEGDSASSTELYALLSALSGLELDQGIAVTGSVNQHGEVQAVGGVTRKIEGFFTTCKVKGLTGTQGVIIPRANLANLMLKAEVVEAVRAGQFHVWAVGTIDEGIELLSGRPAGDRQPDGGYPEGSVSALVEHRLRDYAERIRAFASTDGGARATGPVIVGGIGLPY
jgi:predicted ATP-dependent protease